jgi:hypothetical protein
MNISNQDRLDLKQMLTNMDYQDNTEHIRKVKHSLSLRKDIAVLESLKSSDAQLYNSDIEAFKAFAAVKCDFLYNHYPDIFNKVIKNELHLGIMKSLLEILGMIEDGKLNQEEGSILVGKILKELYLDSAVRTADNINRQYESEKPAINDGDKSISWSEWKSKSINKIE